MTYEQLEETYGKILDIIRVHDATNIIWEVRYTNYGRARVSMGIPYLEISHTDKGSLVANYGYAECNGNWGGQEYLRDGEHSRTLTREIYKYSTLAKEYDGWERHFWQPELEKEWQ